jgi:lipopolysaccharide/colanic/teichoic acid biosynthesis glycosyltransferase
MIRRAIKRGLDIAGAALGLILLSPALVAVSLLVRWKLGRPILFRQTRPGLHGTPFTLVKFRTMREAVDATGRPLPDDARLTPLGRALRRTSLDEAPQLWNVLRGDLSLVGPRPLLMEYLPQYTADEARRHEVRPGMTGLAQVSGRNALSWEEKFALDVWYVDYWSLWLDARILARTVRTVIAREGISGAGEATMAPFRGSAQLGRPRNGATGAQGGMMARELVTGARAAEAPHARSGGSSMTAAMSALKQLQ